MRDSRTWREREAPAGAAARRRRCGLPRWRCWPLRLAASIGFCRSRRSPPSSDAKATPEMQLRGVEDTMRASEDQRRRIEADIEIDSRRSGAAQCGADRHDRQSAGRRAPDRRRQCATDDARRKRKRAAPLARQPARGDRRRACGAATHGAQPAAGDSGAPARYDPGDQGRDAARLGHSRSEIGNDRARPGSRRSCQSAQIHRRREAKISASARPAWPRQGAADRAWSRRANNR